MEVAAILGVASSIANLAEIATACTKSLVDLRANYMTSDLNVQVSITQLSTLKSALMHIAAWRCHSSEVIPYDIGSDLKLSLDSCNTLLGGLYDQLSRLGAKRNTALGFKKKAQFLLNGQEWSNLQTLLSHQISAIHLFLTTIQW